MLSRNITAGDEAVVWVAQFTIDFHNCNNKQLCSEALYSPFFIKGGGSLVIRVAESGYQVQGSAST